MKRIEIETKLNEGRDWILATYAGLSEDELRRPRTQSQHDAESHWNALDHFAHLSLIEDNFVAMIRRRVAGHQNPVGLLNDENGAARSRDEIMASVNAMTERFQREHHNDSLSEVVALTARSRAATLTLLSELSDEQLSETLEGAPWADGTLGGVLGVNADHARQHWHWVNDVGLS